MCHVVFDGLLDIMKQINKASISSNFVNFKHLLMGEIVALEVLKVREQLIYLQFEKYHLLKTIYSPTSSGELNHSCMNANKEFLDYLRSKFLEFIDERSQKINTSLPGISAEKIPY